MRCSWVSNCETIPEVGQNHEITRWNHTKVRSSFILYWYVHSPKNAVLGIDPSLCCQQNWSHLHCFSSTSKGRVSCLANWGDQQWRQDCHQEIWVLTQQTWGFASMNSGLSCDPRPLRPKRHEIWHTSHWPPTASPARSHLAPLTEMFCVFAESGPQTYFTPWSWGVYPT